MNSRWTNARHALCACILVLGLLRYAATADFTIDNSAWGASVAEADGRVSLYRKNSGQEEGTNHLNVVLWMREYERDNHRLVWGPQGFSAVEGLSFQPSAAARVNIFTFGGAFPKEKGNVSVILYMTQRTAATVRSDAQHTYTIPANSAKFVVSLSNWDYERYLNQIELEIQFSSVVPSGDYPPNRALVANRALFNLPDCTIVTVVPPNVTIDGVSSIARSVRSSVVNDIVTAYVRFPFFQKSSTLVYAFDFSVVIPTSPVPQSGSNFFFDEGESIAVVVLIIVSVLGVLCFVALVLWALLAHDKAVEKVRDRIAEWLEGKGLAPTPRELESVLSEEEEVVHLLNPQRSSTDSSSERSFSVNIGRDSRSDSGTTVQFSEDEEFTSDSGQEEDYSSTPFSSENEDQPDRSSRSRGSTPYSQRSLRSDWSGSRSRSRASYTSNRSRSPRASPRSSDEEDSYQRTETRSD